MTMEKKSETEGGLVKILAIFLFVFLGNAAAGSVIIQDGLVGTSNGTSPLRPIHIAATHDANLRLQDTSGASPAAYIEFYNDTTRWGYVGLGGHDDKMTIGTTANKNLAFYTNSSEKMTLTAAGNVGIGTTNPQVKLNVQENQASTLKTLLVLQNDASAGGTEARITGYNNATGLRLVYGREGSAVIDTTTASHHAEIFTTGGDLLFGALTSEKMRITTTGNVGIGTTSPTAKLSIASTEPEVLSTNPAWPVGTLKIADTGAYNSGSGPTITFYKYRDAVGDSSVVGAISGHGVATNESLDFYVGTAAYLGATPKLTIRTSGNVGIGTTSPEKMLEIQSTDPTIRFHYPGNSGSSYVGGNANNDIVLSAMSSGANIIMTTGTGNIGIGTTSPGFPLEIQANSGGNALRMVARAVDNVSSLSFTDNTKAVDAYIQGNGSWIRSRADGGFHFAKGVTPTSTSSEFTIEGLNVGIGTASPEYILDIKSSAATNRVVHQFPDGTSSWFYNVFKDSTSGNFKWGQGVFADAFSDTNLANSYSIYQYYDKNEASVGQYRFLINNAGNVGIGTTAPTQKLDVIGNVKATGTYFSTTPTAIGININGGNAGGTALLLCSRNTGSGDTTASAVYMVRYGYSGNYYSTTLVSGTNFVTFSIDGSGNLLVTDPANGNDLCSVFSNK